MLFSMHQIKAAHEATGGFWFAPETVEWWHSIFAQEVLAAEHGAYFLSRETNPSGVTMWSVRYASDEGQISTVGEFFSHAEQEEAWQAAVAAKAAGVTE